MLRRRISALPNTHSRAGTCDRTAGPAAERTTAFPGFTTMSPEHVDLHRMVDRLDPDQVRALRAVAQQLLRPNVGPPTPASSRPRSRNLCWPTNQCGTSPSLACSMVHRISPSAPRRILRKEFAKRADADR
jgi:hypothetical protein